MKSPLMCFFILVTSLVLLSGYSPESIDRTNIQGMWVRKTDNLRIMVTLQNTNKLYSFIVEEGDEKFPCDVSSIAIYKNIVKIKENLWSCDFLVVTMGSCSTDYEEGMIRINKEGDMEITCPGFSKKIYTRLKPRLDSRKR